MKTDPLLDIDFSIAREKSYTTHIEFLKVKRLSISKDQSIEKAESKVLLDLPELKTRICC